MLAARSTSGFALLLAACFFFPAVRGCNDVVYPYSVPEAWTPYIWGLFTAFAFSRFSRAFATRALPWVSGAVCFGHAAYFSLEAEQPVLLALA